MWFWLGEAASASQRSGTLCQLPSGAKLIAVQDSKHQVKLHWQFDSEQSKDMTSEIGYADDWHNVTIIAGSDKCQVIIDGRADDGTSKDNALTIPIDRVLGTSRSSSAPSCKASWMRSPSLIVRWTRTSCDLSGKPLRWRFIISAPSSHVSERWLCVTQDQAQPLRRCPQSSRPVIAQRLNNCDSHVRSHGRSTG